MRGGPELHTAVRGTRPGLRGHQLDLRINLFYFDRVVPIPLSPSGAICNSTFTCQPTKPSTGETKTKSVHRALCRQTDTHRGVRLSHSL